MLCAGGEAAYISEPLNVLHRPGIFGAPVRHWYTYVCADNEAEYLPALQKTLAFHYHTWDEVRSLRSRKDLLRMGRDWSTFLSGRLGRKRPLLKDPFAVFSAPWFAERLGFQV
ncbi:MAG: sulfotransferase, partial [Anaerolineales bacterium]